MSRTEDDMTGVWFQRDYVEPTLSAVPAPGGCTAACTERMRALAADTDETMHAVCAEFARQLQELQAENDKLHVDLERLRDDLNRSAWFQ